jgi:hypothetical protein
VEAGAELTRSRAWPLVTILFLIVVASCSGRPGIRVTVAGQTVPTAYASNSYRTLCAGAVEDAFPRDVPVTTVRADRVQLSLEGGGGTTAIHLSLYDVDAPPGGPMEEAQLTGRIVTYELPNAVVGHTYQVLVNVDWSAIVSSGTESHLFRLRIAPP